MSERLIYHIAAARDWEQALAEGEYRADSLMSEGFIHASTAGQVPGTANYLFKGRQDLVLLEIDTARLAAEVKYEQAPDGPFFPHIYGALNLDAVQRVTEFKPDADGVFRSL